MILIVYGIALVAVWVLAWGSLSAANVLGGIAVAAVLLWFAPDTLPRAARPRLRVVAIALFLFHVITQIVRSNLTLAREAVARRPRVHSGVMAVPLPEISDGLLTLVANVMALTPGTIPLQVTHDPLVIYVHVMHMTDVEASRREVLDLVTLACRAFGEGR